MSQDWTPPPVSGTTEKVPNYLVPAIISAVCCFPLGIIGVIFAAQVNGKVAAGDIAGAMDASKKAKLFSYIFLGLAIVGWGGYLILWLVIGGLSIFANS
ncbi:MAG TPA: CD225/dispanin family protein [Pyrinomonadaceae bacterium]|nr:CD225/dispanin family protein [Pyrinomonadaceae bacterium]